MKSDSFLNHKPPPPDFRLIFTCPLESSRQNHIRLGPLRRWAVYGYQCSAVLGAPIVSNTVPEKLSDLEEPSFIRGGKQEQSILAVMPHHLTSTCAFTRVIFALSVKYMS